MSILGKSYAIGLDISEKHVAAAQLVKKNGGAAIGGLFHREVAGSQDNDSDLLSCLTELGRSRVFSGKRVVLSIPPACFSVFPLRFTVEEGLSLEEAILSEAERFLPFPLSDAIVDYPSLVPAGDGDSKSYKALITAIRRTDVEKYLGLLAEAHLKTEVLDLAVSSLIRLHHHVTGMGANPVILGHTDDSNSLLVIATGESIAVQRAIKWGSAALLSELCRNMGISGEIDEAKTMLKRYGVAYDKEGSSGSVDAGDPDSAAARRATYQIIAPRVDEFILEMDKVIGYARVEEQHPVFESICLYGQAALVSGLDAYIESRLNIKTQVVNPLERIGLLDEGMLANVEPDAPLSLALGLALRRLPWL